MTNIFEKKSLKPFYLMSFYLFNTVYSAQYDEYNILKLNKFNLSFKKFIIHGLF
jgi:hypothetical protein